MGIYSLPHINDTLFYINKEVKVTRVYALFGLVIVQYLNEHKEFCVDYHALSLKPDNTNSISLYLFEGENHEQYR